MTEIGFLYDPWGLSRMILLESQLYSRALYDKGAIGGLHWHRMMPKRLFSPVSEEGTRTEWAEQVCMCHGRGQW